MYTFTFSPQQNSTNALITFKGDLNLLNIKNIEKEIRNIPLKYSSYNVKVDEVTDIDIPFLQLLYSFTTSIENSNKNIDISIELTDEYKSLLQKTGINNIKGLNQI